MARSACRAIAAAIEARRQRREDDLARAARLKTEAEAANAAFQRTMAEARAEAQAVIKEASDRLAAEAAERQRELADSSPEQIDAAERRIAATKQQALSEVRGIAVDVGRSVVEKLTGSAPDARAADRGGRQRPGGAGTLMIDLLHDHHFWVLVSTAIFDRPGLEAGAAAPSSALSTSAPPASAPNSTRRAGCARTPNACSPIISGRSARR